MILKKTKPKIRKKGWGAEVWIVNNEKYCGKLLKFKNGAEFSDHYHLVKDETWYVLEGELELQHYNLANADKLKTILRKGDVLNIPPGNPHKIIAREASVIVEISTTHDEKDSYRIGKGNSQKK